MPKASATRTLTLALLAAGATMGAQAPAVPPTSVSPDPTAALIQTTCAACHPVPSPEILPKSAWKSVVLDMTGLIVQGIGKMGRFHAGLSRDYHTQVVGGVAPGKGGTVIDDMPIDFLNKFNGRTLDVV